MKILSLLIATALTAQASCIIYEGEAGPKLGKHIVFLASDHEYRAEEASSALARIPAERMGFKCTVVFGVDKDGFIEAGSSNLSGLDALKNADLFIISARFLNPPDEEMAHIESYLERTGHAKKVKPSDLADWESAIMPKRD